MNGIAAADHAHLIAGVRRAEPRALGRAVSLLLRGGAASDAFLERLAECAGTSHRVGVTGAPGIGKSTLVAALARGLRQRGETLGVLAVDPASPRHGGAVLGDRLRLAGFQLAADAGVYFRSIAYRGQGGLDASTERAMVALEAAGYPWVFVETVGAGQADWLIEEWVDTVVVVVSPAVGDDMQIEKAGLLEVADILVVNHGDRTEAENVARLLRERVDGGSGKRPPVVVTESLQGRGIDTLLEELRARGARRDAPRGREAARGEPGAETET